MEEITEEKPINLGGVGWGREGGLRTKLLTTFMGKVSKQLNVSFVCFAIYSMLW